MQGYFRSTDNSTQKNLADQFATSFHGYSIEIQVWTHHSQQNKIFLLLNGLARSCVARRKPHVCPCRSASGHALLCSPSRCAGSKVLQATERAYQPAAGLRPAFPQLQRRATGPAACGRPAACISAVAPLCSHTCTDVPALLL